MERSGNFYKAIRLGYILISILIGCMVYSNNGHDEYIFKSKLGGTVGTIYKVEKIKVGKQIIFELSDPAPVGRNSVSSIGQNQSLTSLLC